MPQGPLRTEVSRLRNSYFDALWESEQPAEAKREYETAGLSSRERPSCILKANLCCWKKAILGWCRKAQEGAAAVFFGRLSEYLGEAAAIRKLIHEENAC
jgi:hypothetical protein